MKVNCPNCGKRFDYDMYSGICPKCGKYHRINAGETDSRRNYFSKEEMEAVGATKAKANRAYSDTTDKAVNADKKRTADANSRPKRGKAYYKVTLLLVIAIVTIGVGIPMAAYIVNEKNYEASSLKELPMPKHFETGTPLRFETEYEPVTLTITGVSIDEDPRYELPAGYEVVIVSYNISDDTPPIYNDGNNRVFFLTNELIPYLITKSGRYLSPVYPSYIENVKGYDYETTSELGISYELYHETGQIYFMVKQGDMKGLRINCYDESDSGQSLYGVGKKLKEVYELTDLKPE